ncbi:putative alcohol dehydrogenase [Cystobasidium minutum MCA 4210]|uniref:putative alcohol dehydrogenase n=1 Tax=Cystobasidium minutum MCA 4210 TaxID=1397322 RepID=UPI0034CD196D|eukprot:jgi/Rhomi1/210278/estExt_Genemark1.C_3_t30022
MSTSETLNFTGWCAVDEKAADGGLVSKPFEPKPWDEDDVEMKVLYCGICGSDYSWLSSEWGPVQPGTVCGHEVVGVCTKVGSKVENGIQVGDMLGVGAQGDSCRECDNCKAGYENYCKQIVWSFGAPYHRGNAGKQGATAKGGFSKYWRGPSRFAIPIPDGIDPAEAGPLMCGGITVYSPLMHYGAGTTRKKVGVIGVGGLGHMAILFAKAMGAEVTAISRSESKKADAEKLGATGYIATGNDVAAAAEANACSLDLIICTINPEEFKELGDYLKLLKPYGHIVLVGIVPKPLVLQSFQFIWSGAAVAGSTIGSPQELKEMLEFAAKHKIHPWIQKYNMDDINKALPDFKAGKPRYRFVLVNTDQGGKL